MHYSNIILRLDASVNVSSSNSKKLGDEFIARLARGPSGITVSQRDLNREPEFIDETWIAANLTPAEDRSEAQKQRLAYSDRLIEELQQAHHVLLTTPMYNFSIPATLKAWIDLVCRAGITFQYTAEGPVGLLNNKRVDIIITTGGVPLNSPADFVSGYLKQVFAFIGISDVHIVAADQMNRDAHASYENAQALIRQRLESLDVAA